MVDIDATHPARYTVRLNNWLLFGQPGTYRLSVNSMMVRLGDTAKSPPALAISPTVTLTITEADAAGRLKRLSVATQAMAGDSPEAHRAAMRDLRCMRDSRAIDLLFMGLDDPDIDARTEAMLGLEAQPNALALKAPLQAYLDRPGPLLLPAYAVRLAGLAAAVGAAEATDPTARRQRGTQAIIEMYKYLTAKVVAALPTLSPGEASANVASLLLGNHLPADSQAYWKIVLAGAAVVPEAQRSDVARAISRACAVPALAPTLSALARNTSADARLRGAAVEALARLDVSIAEHLDMLADDAMLPRPALLMSTLRLVGAHRIDEIGAALVKLLDDPDPAVGASAAQRISELNVPVATADLVAKLDAIADPFTLPGKYTHRDLLSALSARDRTAAWPRLRAVLDDARWAKHPSRDTALACAAASDRDEARAYVTAIFTEGALPRLLPLLRAMSTEVASAGGDVDPTTRQRLAWWVPELIDAYAAGRSSETRRYAQTMLTTITGVTQESPTEAVDGLAARYEEWLGAHRQEIGR